MAADIDAAAAQPAAAPVSRSYCGRPLRVKSAMPARNRHYAESVERRRRVLNIATWIAAGVSASFAVMEFVTTGLWQVAIVNGVTALVLMVIPLLHRFGELVAPLTLIGTAYIAVTVVAWTIGTGSGTYFYFFVAAVIALLVFGNEHIVVACTVIGIGAAITVALHFRVPTYTDAQPLWASDLGFVISTLSALVMIVATVSYALREISRAEEAMEQEYERSESLLANILPTSVAARLKNPSTTIVADKYDDASVLFADIAGYTERASQSTPAELVAFLNALYTEFDHIVERHGLEKIKTTGDCYMVVSGVPEPRDDHVEALACLALDMIQTAAGLTDESGRAVPIRIGIGVGPVVAGVVGERRFFYDVWGDAVNVASRMESNGVEGRIQVPAEVYARLKDDFVFEERGGIMVKGKGLMRTWFLVAPRTSQPDDDAALVTQPGSNVVTASGPA